jgi:hypothetical protein
MERGMRTLSWRRKRASEALVAIFGSYLDGALARNGFEGMNARCLEDMPLVSWTEVRDGVLRFMAWVRNLVGKK